MRFLLFAATALAAPTALLPWELQNLNTFSPSGYPGSSPYVSLNAVIVDPNTIHVGQGQFGSIDYPASQATCSTKWYINPPWNQELPCASNSSYSVWTFKMIKGTSPTTNFTLSFQLTDGIIGGNDGVAKFRNFTGGDHFEVGKNMAGSCGASSACSWGLKSSPYAIKQK